MSDHVLITGGAGFVGTNLAHRLLTGGESVLLLDNLSRPSVERNIEWLKRLYERRCVVRVADVRDPVAVQAAVAEASCVFHFAAQVGVAQSLVAPVHDFEVNARGTLNVLEAIRALPSPPPLIYTSTSKVYGAMEDLTVQLNGLRYEPEDPELRRFGVSEARARSLLSPHGCSKGTADQYVLDYAQTYGLSTVVLRLSCVYGPHQLGTGDPVGNVALGWVARFLQRAMKGAPLTLHGDGHQVRDILFVTDLVDALLRARDQVQSLRGLAFNVGGGPENAVSLVEVITLLADLNDKEPLVLFEDWRAFDPRYYVSDTRRFETLTGWRPQVGVREGVTRLYRWVLEMNKKSSNNPKGEEPTARGA